jgi:hypothetical protein
MNRAIFFDRDGTLNEEVGYLWAIEKFKWIDGAREAIKITFRMLRRNMKSTRLFQILSDSADTMLASSLKKFSE